MNTALIPWLTCSGSVRRSKRADSLKEWVTGNYGVTTTSALEWWFVVEPDGDEAAKARGGADKDWPTEERLRSKHRPSENPRERLSSALQVTKQMRKPKRMLEFKAQRDKVDAQLQKLGQPGLIDEEFFGGRLYTGPCALRRASNRIPCISNAGRTSLNPSRAQSL